MEEKYLSAGLIAVARVVVEQPTTELLVSHMRYVHTVADENSNSLQVEMVHNSTMVGNGLEEVISTDCITKANYMMITY